MKHIPAETVRLINKIDADAIMPCESSGGLRVGLTCPIGTICAQLASLSGKARLCLAIRAAFGEPVDAATTFKGTHGTGFCNSAFFITHAKQLGKEYGLTLEFVNTPTSAELVTFLGAGMVDVSVLPYTSFIALYDKGAPVKIIGGAGIEGLGIIAQPGLDTAAKLKGKTLGTFQMDTLEVLPTTG